MRIGHGYDVHRLAEGRRCVLGGVEIPYERGLAGHSDADVVLHALSDAILGACGARDIGFYFSPDIEETRDIDSAKILAFACEKASEAGFYGVNADITVVAQAPKLSAYIEQMKKNIEKIAGFAVNIKATTEEGLGFTGAGEGIACHAVVLLENNSRIKML